jgi:hypothetical protein
MEAGGACAVTFLAGDEPTAAELEDLLGLRVVKTVAETVNNSAVLQNDDELFLTVAASTTYRFLARLIYTSGVTPDIKFGFTYPVGAIGSYTLLGIAAGGAALSAFHQTETSVSAMEGATGTACTMTGTWTIGVTPGIIQLQWAQNTANASNTQLLTGSFLELVKFS